MTTTQTLPDLAVHRPAHSTAAVILIRDDAVLLQRNAKDAPAYASMWDLPRLAVGADGPEAAVISGAESSWGFKPVSFHLVGAGDDLVDGQCWRRFIYRVSEWQGDPAPAELQRWYSRREFADVFQLNPLAARWVEFD